MGAFDYCWSQPPGGEFCLTRVVKAVGTRGEAFEVVQAHAGALLLAKHPDNGFDLFWQEHVIGI